MVMGRDSCSEGHGFESRHCILDGHNIFSHKFVVRVVMFVWRMKINEKESEDVPFEKNFKYERIVVKLNKNGIHLFLSFRRRIFFAAEKQT